MGPSPNRELSVFASKRRSRSHRSKDLYNYNNRGIIVTIDVTDAADTPSVTFDIKYKDTLSGKYVSLLQSAAITGTGTTSLTVYPGVTAVNNVAASKPLPKIWRIEADHSDSDNIWYSVSANYII